MRTCLQWFEPMSSVTLSSRKHKSDEHDIVAAGGQRLEKGVNLVVTKNGMLLDPFLPGQCVPLLCTTSPDPSDIRLMKKPLLASQARKESQSEVVKKLKSCSS